MQYAPSYIRRKDSLVVPCVLRFDSTPSAAPIEFVMLEIWRNGHAPTDTLQLVEYRYSREKLLMMFGGAVLVALTDGKEHLITVHQNLDLGLETGDTVMLGFSRESKDSAALRTPFKLNQFTVETLLNAANKHLRKSFIRLPPLRELPFPRQL